MLSPWSAEHQAAAERAKQSAKYVAAVDSIDGMELLSVRA